MLESDIAQKEYEDQLNEARDACARRVAVSTSISSADAAQSDLRYRIKRIDALSEDQLVDLADKRKQQSTVRPEQLT